MAGGEFIHDCNILSTFDVGAAGGTREDLLDIITNVSPEETTFLSSFSKKPAKNIQHDWLLDSLEQPGDPNRGDLDVHCTPESSDANFTVKVPRCRVNNLTHIFRATGDISETQRAVDNAGMADEYAYQKLKSLKELALKIEFALIHSRRADQFAPQYEGECASPAGCRKMDGIFAIAEWNDHTFSCLDAEKQGTILNPAGSPCTDLTPELIDDLNELMWDKGVNPRDIYVSAELKRAISRFYIWGNDKQTPASAKTLVNVIDTYESDFGLRALHIHRYMPDHTLLMLAEEFFSVPVLRPVKSYELAKVGNSDKYMIEGELSLEVRSPAAIGVLQDVCPGTPCDPCAGLTRQGE